MTFPQYFLPGSDYIRTTGFVEFNPGEIFKEVNVSIVDDTVLEGPEMFFANLTSFEPNIIIEESRDRADISIADNDRE